jgi:hypothetical protein
LVQLAIKSENPHVGSNPATAMEARKAVSDFLQALFKLG